MRNRKPPDDRGAEGRHTQQARGRAPDGRPGRRGGRRAAMQTTPTRRAAGTGPAGHDVAADGLEAEHEADQAHRGQSEARRVEARRARLAAGRG